LERIVLMTLKELLQAWLFSKRRLTLFLGAQLSICLLGHLQALAEPSNANSPGSQNAWSPTQTIKIIVPFTAGTGMDTIARAVQPRLSERLGQAVVVQNMPGASGNIGAEFVSKSPPDASTLLMGANTMLIASQLYKGVGYHPLRDFAPVSMAAYGTLMLVAHPKTGFKSVRDLIAAAKKSPGDITFGSPGVATPHHMAMELFKSQANLFMLHVPYKGTSGYTQDLLSGEVMTGFLPIHVAQGFVNSGQLTALAVGSTKRHPIAPNVPTFIEQGFKDIDLDLWYGFFLPSKTPAAAVERMNKELSAVLGSAEMHEILGKAGLDSATSTSGELGRIAMRDYQKWGDLIRSKGIKFE
jgi:tripartite-type tricarboxylate transporter receptor subunit TctC